MTPRLSLAADLCEDLNSSSVSRDETPSGRFSTTSIDLCIPAISRDIESGCLSRAVLGARKQRVWPSSIIVSLSGSSLEDASRTKKYLTALASPIPLKIVRASEIYVQGKSRNNALLASTAELITFLDADDDMHPDRIHVIEQTFAKNRNLKMVLHGYTQERTASWQSNSFSAHRDAVIKMDTLCQAEARTRHQPHLDLHLHHAHVTVNHDILENFTFDESAEAFRLEDSLFVRKVLSWACNQGLNESVYFLDVPLTYYERPGADCSGRHQ